MMRPFLLALAALGLCCSYRSIAAAEPADLSPWFAPQAWKRDVEGPILSLGQEGQFDDRHIFAPAVVEESGRFLLWYSGSRGTPGNRVFRLGLATSDDGQRFEKHAGNPVLGMSDNAHSVLTPALLRNPDGSVLRQNGKLRMWFASATLGKGGLHTLHETTSDDGIHWSDPSPALLENAYCPTVLKSDTGFEMWYSDVSRRPWVIRHATSADGQKWTVSERPALQLSQNWEAEVLVYPCVLKINGTYLMWYGSYDRAIRRETTAIGFAVSRDGMAWHKHPENPVLRPDPQRPWESNYVGSGSVLRLADGSFRYWYASRRRPPFENLYFALNTAHWTGLPARKQEPPELPAPVSDYLARLRDAGLSSLPLPLPPQKDDVGDFANRPVDVLEVVDGQNAIVRAWQNSSAAAERDETFSDLWLAGLDTSALEAGQPARLSQVFHVTGSQFIDTACGKRSFPRLETVKLKN
jgi:predicted GH43/DUF377 family glycosyl hydrolase